MRDAQVQFFALWGKDHAYALDAYPNEFGPYIAEWNRARQQFMGPFTDAHEALKIALNRCYDLRNDGKKRKRKRRQPWIVVQTWPTKPSAELMQLVEKVLLSG